MLKNDAKYSGMSVPDMIQWAGGIELCLWLLLIGKSRTTGWKWRKTGPNGEPPRIRCVRIDRSWYLTAQEIKRFWERARQGEFAGDDAGVCVTEESKGSRRMKK